MAAMGWILDLFSNLSLTPEFVTKLDDLESQFSVLERESVNLKLEIDKLRNEVKTKEREKQELYQENQDLRKTREISHILPSEKPAEPERTHSYIQGNVYDPEAGVEIHAAIIELVNLETKHRYQTATDKQGNFSLSLPIGIYAVKISHDDYFTFIGSAEAPKEGEGYANFSHMVRMPKGSGKPRHTR
jgi:hypothetical protein